MTSTQNLIAAGSKVTARSTTIINGLDFTTTAKATVLYFDDDTNTYVLVSGRRTFAALAASVALVSTR